MNSIKYACTPMFIAELFITAKKWKQIWKQIHTHTFTYSIHTHTHTHTFHIYIYIHTHKHTYKIHVFHIIGMISRAVGLAALKF